ncbi:MAG: DMT family transporter [Eubacterium sp.]
MNKTEFEHIIKKTASVCICAMLCCALWGSAFPVIKTGYKILNIASDDSASQMLFAGLRFILAGVLTILFASAFSKRLLLPKKSSLPKIAVLSLFQTVLQYLFFYVGLAHTTGTKGSIINSLSSFFAVIIAAVMKTEKITPSKIFGCVLGFSGVVIVNLAGFGLDMNMSFLGEGFMALSALSYALSTVFIKRYSQQENPVALSGYQFIVGGIIMALAGSALGGKIKGFNGEALALIVYLAFVSAFAYTLWGILLKYNDVSRVAVFGFMTPVFGCLLSALILQEDFFASGLKSAAALLLVSLGIFIVNKKRKVKKYD